MLHVISGLTWSVLQPSMLLALAGGVGIMLLTLGRRQRLALGLVWGAGLLAVLIGIFPFAETVARPLEDRFPRPMLDRAPDGLVLLGGAEEARLADARGAMAFNDASERLIETAALALRYPTARIIISGGSIWPDRSFPSEAETAARVLERLGIARSRIILEDRSRNTAENARFTADLGVIKPSETWLLVTSAWHMPRSVGAFRAVGLNLVAFPVDYRTRPQAHFGPARRNWPDGLFTFDIMVREWVGLVAYRTTGRSTALFPAP
jgi:uncharacterized SAM-binding protein YcdF (DUF218 family)